MSQTNPLYLPDFDIEIERQWQAPKMYQVLLHNDDYTPMDFVVDVLCRFFSMTDDKATEVMLKVHYDGKAVCAIYTADVAETKVNQVHIYARENEHPLLCTMEPVE